MLNYQIVFWWINIHNGAEYMIINYRLKQYYTILGKAMTGKMLRIVGKNDDFTENMIVLRNLCPWGNVWKLTGNHHSNFRGFEIHVLYRMAMCGVYFIFRHTQVTTNVDKPFQFCTLEVMRRGQKMDATVKFIAIWWDTHGNTMWVIMDAWWDMMGSKQMLVQPRECGKSFSAAVAHSCWIKVSGKILHL